MEIKKLGNIYSELWLRGLSALPAGLNKLPFEHKEKDIWRWRSPTKAYFETSECLSDCETKLIPYMDTLVQLQREPHVSISLKAFTKPLGYKKPILWISPANANFASCLKADIELKLIQYPQDEPDEEEWDWSYIEVQDRTKTPIVQASFSFMGIDFDVDMDFEHISKTLDVPYSKIRSKHNFPQSSKDYGFAVDFWSIKTPNIYKVHDLGAEFDKLIKPLLGKEDIIEQLTRENRLVTEVGGVFHTYEDHGIPKMLFSRELIDFTAKTNTHLSIDYYCY